MTGRWIVLVGACGLLACAGSPSEGDAGSPADAALDAGGPTMPEDAGATDASASDAAAPDSGVPPEDAGAVDAGVRPPCENGVLDPGEESVDCGGACPPCEDRACTQRDSDDVPDGYDCVFSEEFGGAVGGGQARAVLDPSTWIFQNLDVNGEAQNYTNRECADPAHASDWNYCVQDGLLTIRARDDGIDCTDGADADNQPDNPDCALDWGEARGATGFTSGRIITKNTVEYQYGYIEFRARLPQWTRTPQSGLWPAIWLLGSNISEGPPPGDTPWPGCGEFDILEWKSPSNNMGWNALWRGADDSLDACSDFPEGGNAACGPCEGGPCRGVEANEDRWRWRGWNGFPHSAFHTYGLLWTEEVMEVFIDGEKMSTFRIDGPAESEFRQPMFLIVNLAIGGSLGGAIQVSDWSTATLEVDYLRWYRPRD